SQTARQRQEERMAALQKEIDELQAVLGRDAEKIVSKHIKHLHRYNEAKDAAQILIGKLASYKETTIRQIHDDLGLKPDD
ncbi:DNA repair protein, partial [Vararia minispora EC-137]